MQRNVSSAVVTGASLIMAGVLAVAGQFAGAHTIDLAGWLFGAGSTILLFRALLAVRTDGTMPIVGAAALLGAMIYAHISDDAGNSLIVAAVGLLVFPSTTATTRHASRWLRRLASLCLILAILVLATSDSEAGRKAMYVFAACWGLSYLGFCIALIGDTTPPVLDDGYLL